jgi:hypothetical protein
VAAQGGHNKALELVVAADADVNAKNDIGFTKLALRRFITQR